MKHASENVSLADILTTRCGHSSKASLIIIVQQRNYHILYFSFTKELQLVTICVMVDADIMFLMMSLCNGTRNDGSEFANMLILDPQSIKHGELKYSLSHNNREKNKALDYPQLIKRSNHQVPAQFDFAGTKSSIAGVHSFRSIHKKIGSSSTEKLLQSSEDENWFMQEAIKSSCYCTTCAITNLALCIRAIKEQVTQWKKI